MNSAYKSSTRSVGRSQEDVRRVLAKYGASRVSFEEDWTGSGIVAVRFMFLINSIPYGVRIRSKVPYVENKTPTRGKLRSQDQIYKLREQAQRTIWRAIYWAIKSRMEAVEFGIETFQEAFLAHFEIPGQDGDTIGDRLIPQLDSGRLMLPAPKST